MQIQGVAKHGLYSFTFGYVKEFIEKIYEEENNVIYRLTGAFTALPLTLVIGTANKFTLLSISVVVPLLSTPLLKKIKPLKECSRDSTNLSMSLHTFQILFHTLLRLSISLIVQILIPLSTKCSAIKITSKQHV